MIVRTVTRRIYERGLRALERGDVDALLQQFHPDCTMTFAGDTPLGADGLVGPELQAWFERFLRLLRQPRFEIVRFAVVGPPWRQRLSAHVTIRSTVDGEPYSNQFAHFLTIRWGRVIEDVVLEDTQRWERACRRLTAAGVVEANAPPL
jgi:ketosteroid isomerase-like protein